MTIAPHPPPLKHTSARRHTHTRAAPLDSKICGVPEHSKRNGSHGDKGQCTQDLRHCSPILANIQLEGIRGCSNDVDRWLHFKWHLIWQAVRKDFRACLWAGTGERPCAHLERKRGSEYERLCEGVISSAGYVGCGCHAGLEFAKVNRAKEMEYMCVLVRRLNACVEGDTWKYLRVRV
jgi:hypothetical protein